MEHCLVRGIKDRYADAEYAQNVNTVDVLYPSWPIFLYTNPVLGKYLLEPVLAYVATGQYDPPYAIHDIGKSLSTTTFVRMARWVTFDEKNAGASYPNATGHNDGNDQVMGLEGPRQSPFFGSLTLISSGFRCMQNPVTWSSWRTATIKRQATRLF